MPNAGSIFSVNDIRTSPGDVWIVLPTAGVAALRKACASSLIEMATHTRKRLTMRRFICFHQKEADPGFGKKVVQVKMQLGDKADVVARPCVNRNNRLRADLEIFSRPNQAGINCASCFALLATIKRSFKCEFDQRNQSIKR